MRLAPSTATAATLTRGPYLQLLTRQSVTVVWNTEAAAACALAIRPLDGMPTVRAGGTGTVCAIAADGLAPGTVYAYTPLADGVPLAPEAVFRTNDPSRPFSFLVIGDSGCDCSDQLAVRDTMLKTPADFILHTGDMVYDTGAPQDFDPSFFAPYRDLIRRLVLWPCLGNHDVETAGGAPWRDVFHTPANNPAGSEDYYSFDDGNAHVVVLDSNASTRPGSAQYTFLDHDLAASTATWKLVAFHHTIYSSGGVHGSNLTIRANLVPLFDAHGVDLVLMGHEHNYERTKPLRGNQVVSAGQGTTYITTGGGGQALYRVGSSSFTAHSESVHHFTRLAVNDGSLLAQMIRTDGTIGDEVMLMKGGVPLPPRCGDGLVNQPGEQCDGADRAACAGPCAADCTCAPVCGDGRVDPPAEACDGSDDAACPGLCLSSCRCGDPADFLTLPPAADTFIESGTQATWDHGAAAHLDASALSDLIYLKFDLSAVPAPVTRATLMLHCIDGSDDGGAIYPVADSRWVEGDRTGLDATSALGPGLKWSDVDTNGDVVVDTRDTSPWLPEFARAMRGFGSVVAGRDFTVDVTPAFQAGPGLYALAITTNSSNKVTYSSRESATPPVLRVELAPPGTTTTTSTSMTSTTSSTVPTTSTTVPTTSTSTTSTTTSVTSTTSTTTTSTTSSTTSSTSTTSTTVLATTTSTTSTTTTTSTTSSTVPTTSTTVPTTSTSTTSTTTSATSTTSATTTSTTSSTTSSTSTTSTTVLATTTSTTSTTTTTSTTSSTVPTTSTTVPATTTSTTTTSTSTTTTPTSPSATTSTTTSVVPSTTTLPPGTTSTTTPPDDCQTDADCDRDDPCRPRRCVAQRCQDAPLMGLEAVRCALALEGERALACGGRRLPPTLSLALGRTRAAIEAAESSGSVKHARNALRGALRLLDAAARKLRKTEASHAIDADCGRALRGVLRDARVLAKRYLKNRPETAARTAVPRGPQRIGTAD